jgi:gluconokinase
MPEKLPVRFVIVMGVSGSGKTSVGERLAGRLGWSFYDADNFHPPENVEKMARSIPLMDADRLPWLTRLHDLIHDHLQQDKPGVLACSALRLRYRDLLRADNAGVGFVYLHTDYETIFARMQARNGHYMKAGMLQSQFDTLEEPSTAEALQLDASQPLDTLMDQIIAWLG